MLSLFAGAGFSKWAADLPVASELFDFAIDPLGTREEAKLRLVKGLKGQWDRDSPSGTAEQFVARALSMDARHRKAVLWYIVRRLSEPYLWVERRAGRWRRHVLMIDEHRKRDRPGVEKAQHFLVQTLGMHLRGIITTNYDLVLEYALGTKGFNYGTPGERLHGRGPYPVSQWRNPVTLRGSVPLSKVHGSISWDDTARYTDGRRGLTGNALIVAPVPGKGPPPSLEAEWGLSAKILQASSHLLVFGFAFNPYDQDLLELFRGAGQGVRSVMIVDIDPREERAHAVWPSAEVSTARPPPDGDKDLRLWLRSCRKRTSP